MTALTPERFTLPPRDGWSGPDLEQRRESPFKLVRDAGEDGAGDGLTLDGFGAVFNRVTVIDSWEGRFKEKLSSGSMKKSFREKPPKIQFDHGRHPLIGSIPIAQLRSITEESHPELAPDGGAHIVGRLLDNWLIEPVRDAIAAEAINGMSFRMSILREAWYETEGGKQIRDEDKLRELLRRTWYEDVPEEELPLRDIREVKVPEMGPVVWPAYEETSVGVRSVVIDLGRLHEPEQRQTLARAVFLADAAERSADEDESQATAGAAGERESDTGTDTPRSTDDKPAGEHESEIDPTSKQRADHDALRMRGIL